MDYLSYVNNKRCDVSTLKGLTLSRVERNGNEILFYSSGGRKFAMYHEQDCCEHVCIEDICGELSWLEGSPILRASEDNNVNREPLPGHDDSYTWTFYNIATALGHVTIRWYGTSNGYYSEGVDFVELA